MKSFLPRLLLVTFFAIIFFFIPRLTGSVFASSLILNPPFASVPEGKDLSIDFVIKGNDEVVAGVDAVASYDTNLLRVKQIKEGSFFSDYPVKKFDSGKIIIRALAPATGVKISGDIILATVNFEILDSGQTSVILDFQKDSTTDSNIPLLSNTSDTLNEVQSGSYNVVATPENIKLAKARKAKGGIPLWPFFIILLLISGAGIWYYLKNRKPPKEDVFIPEEFPLDRPPKLE